MFKLVVLCAIIAAAAAEPGLLASSLAYTSPIAAPLAYSGAIAAPASYVSPVSTYVQPAVYSTPYSFPHFIKKRSAAFVPTTYIASSPLATPYSTHIVPSAPYYPISPVAPIAPVAYSTATHFIKKRSAPLHLPASYIAPIPYAAATPYVSYSAPLHPAPYFTSPLTYPTHFIKKRSAALAYAAPAAVSHQSRVDYSGPIVSSYAAVSPVGYAGPGPIAYSAASPISYASPFATPVAL